MLQDEGDLHFCTNAWTSPNHKAFIGITIHFQKDGQPMSLVLDVIEVARVSDGIRKKKDGLLRFPSVT